MRHKIPEQWTASVLFQTAPHSISLCLILVSYQEITRLSFTPFQIHPRSSIAQISVPKVTRLECWWHDGQSRIAFLSLLSLMAQILSLMGWISHLVRANVPHYCHIIAPTDSQDHNGEHMSTRNKQTKWEAATIKCPTLPIRMESWSRQDCLLAKEVTLPLTESGGGGGPDWLG